MASPPAPPQQLSPPIRRRGVWRSLVVATIATALTTVAIVAPALPAQAKPSAADVQKQIDTLNNQIETVVEQYNGVHTKLAKDRADATRLSAALQPAKIQAADAKDLISQIAGNIYMTGRASGLTVLLDADSATSFINQLGALNTIAKHQRTQVSTASAVVDKYQTQQSKLATLIKSETIQDQQLAAKKKDIQAQLSKLNSLERQLSVTTTSTGGGGGGGGGGGSTSSGGVKGSGPKTSKSYVMPVACPQTAGSGKGRTAALKACSLVWGAKAPHIHWYHWASAGPSTYDCSGMTMTAWAAANVSLDHFTGGQYKETKRVSRSDLQVGDLVFYYGDHHHVALYIGNGYIAQAQHTGEPLKVSPIGSPTGYGRPH